MTEGRQDASIGDGYDMTIIESRINGTGREAHWMCEDEHNHLKPFVT